MNTKVTRILPLFLFLASLFVSLSVSAQDFESIKNDPSYVWGQGSGESLQSADDNAVKDLVSQISMNIDNQTETTISNEQRGDEAKSSVSTSGNLRGSRTVSVW